jgi:hypothetical protein
VNEILGMEKMTDQLGTGLEGAYSLEMIQSMYSKESH